MKVISVTHLGLVRARKGMAKAYENGDWQAIKDYDQLLAAMLNQAFDDPHRDHCRLAKELERVLSLYGSIVRQLPDAAIEEWRQPELVN